MIGYPGVYHIQALFVYFITLVASYCGLHFSSTSSKDKTLTIIFVMSTATDTTLIMDTSHSGNMSLSGDLSHSTGQTRSEYCNNVSNIGDKLDKKDKPATLDKPLTKVMSSSVDMPSSSNLNDLYKIKWAVCSKIKCDLAEHEIIQHSSEKLHNTFEEAYIDYAKFCGQEGTDFVPNKQYMVRMICKPNFEQMYDVLNEDEKNSKDKILTGATVNDFFNTKFGFFSLKDEKFLSQPKEKMRFKWLVKEYQDCHDVSDAYSEYEHYVIKEESTKFFDNLFECILDFEINANYEKYNIKIDWQLMIECVKPGIVIV